MQDKDIKKLKMEAMLYKGDMEEFFKNELLKERERQQKKVGLRFIVKNTNLRFNQLSAIKNISLKTKIDSSGERYIIGLSNKDIGETKIVEIKIHIDREKYDYTKPLLFNESYYDTWANDYYYNYCFSFDNHDELDNEQTIAFTDYDCTIHGSQQIVTFIKDFDANVISLKCNVTRLD